MTTAEANRVVNSLAVRCQREWSDARLALFTHDLLESSIGGLPFEVIADTLTRLVGELDPDAVTLSRLIEAVKTKPVIPRRKALPGPPEPLGDTPTQRGLRRAAQAGLPALPPREQERALMAERLLKIGIAMKPTCMRCREAMTEDDLLVWIHALMEAGAKGTGEPERRCLTCIEVPF